MGNTVLSDGTLVGLTKLPRTYGKYLKKQKSTSASTQTSTHVWEILSPKYTHLLTQPNFHARMGNTPPSNGELSINAKLPRTYGKYAYNDERMNRGIQTSTHVWEIHGGWDDDRDDDPNFHARMGNT